MATGRSTLCIEVDPAWMTREEALAVCENLLDRCTRGGAGGIPVRLKHAEDYEFLGFELNDLPFEIFSALRNCPGVVMAAISPIADHDDDPVSAIRPPMGRKAARVLQ